MDIFLAYVFKENNKKFLKPNWIKHFRWCFFLVFLYVRLHIPPVFVGSFGIDTHANWFMGTYNWIDEEVICMKLLCTMQWCWSIINFFLTYFWNYVNSCVYLYDQYFTKLLFIWGNMFVKRIHLVVSKILCDVKGPISRFPILSYSATSLDYMGFW